MAELELPTAPTPITAAFVRDLAARATTQPPGRRIDIKDSVQPGLALRVYPSGVLTWIARYSVRGERSARDSKIVPVDAGTITDDVLGELRSHVAAIRRAAVAGRNLLASQGVAAITDEPVAAPRSPGARPSAQVPTEPVALTVSFIRNLRAAMAAQPPDKRLDIKDKEQPGLTLRVHPSGVLTWVARYSIKGDKIPKDVSLGPVDASTISADILGERRRRVADIRRAAVVGRDLLDEERQAVATRKAAAEAAAAAANTLRVKAAAELFLNEYRGKSRGRVLSASSVKGYRWAADRLVERCGDRPIDQLTADEAMRPAHDLLAAGKETSAHAYTGALRTMLKWLGLKKLVSLQLYVEIERVGSIQERDRVLEADELADILQAARTLGYPWQGALLLLAYTGARRDEIGELRVSEVRVADNMILIPRERMKSRREFSIPLTACTRAIVENAIAARPKDSEFVFSTTGRTPVSGWSKMKARLDDLVAEIRAKRAGRAKPTDADRLAPWVIHDLRRTFRTNASACRVVTDIKELLLGHTVGKLERTYDRWTYFDERLEALRKIEQRYDKFEAAARGNVVNLNR